MNLSTHFTLVEAGKSRTANRCRIDNTPPQEVHNQLINVAENILEVVRSEYGSFTPNSWYRCLELNKYIGSKDTSQHVKGEAVDFEIVGVPNLKLAHWCAENLDTYDQIILEFYKEDDLRAGWVHVSLCCPDKPNRGGLLTISKAGTVAGLPRL